MLRKGLGLDAEEGGFEQSDDARWLASMTDTLRRIFAGEALPSDDVERITLALQERAKAARSQIATP